MYATQIGAKNVKRSLLRRLPAVIGSLALIAVTGCNVGPNYKRPTYPTPPAFHGADNAAVATDSSASIGDQQWSQVFHDPDLKQLIARALSNNYDIRIAAERVAEQRAQVQITRSQQFPQLTGGGSGVGASIPSTSGVNIDSPLSFGSFDLSASWTPDFWGLYRRQTEAARATLLAQVWAQRAVRLSLVQQVVTDYLQLRAYDQQLVVAKQTLKVRQDSVQLTETLERGGSSPLSDVRQAEQLLYTATSQIPQLEQGVQQEENAINLLLGQNPGVPVPRAGDPIAPPPENLPVGLPSQLLERRPDIEQAEQTLVAANAQIGVARAQFFPQLTLTASAGLGGNEWSNLFDPAGKTIYGIGQLAQPIFEGGKLTGQLRQAQATERAMLLTYQQTIAGAFRDVSNALVAYNKQRAYREEQEKLVAAAKDATRLARLRYQGGATGYLEVLTTDSSLFAAQLNLVSAQQGEALTLVQLYTTLGGGWQ
ncbi:efflux transporter outer membrane subunit [Acidipila sp. EB88]|nr:efflux transporter outer membrane subunit [Acidipila sp. EB88]